MGMWLGTVPAFRYERHFGDRVVRCYTERHEGIEQMFAAAVDRWPDAEAVVDGATRLSYRGLDARVEAIAAGLQRRGVGTGDRVALFLGNSVEFVAILYAIARIGAISVPINIREQAPGLAYILGHCGAAAVFFDPALEERLPPDGSAPAIRVRIGDGLDALTADAGAAERAPAGGDETGMIMYTSGTTGRPKGAMLSQVGLVIAAMSYVALMGLRAGERSAVPAPMSHITGITAGILPMPLVGGCVLNLRAFKAALFLDFAAAERMSFVVMVPAMYALCLLQPGIRDLDLSRWRVGAYGGAPMAAVTIEQLKQMLPSLDLMNVYGSTETLGPQVMCPPGESLRKREFVGVAIPTADILIMDDDGVEMPRGEIGEIWIRGGSVAGGYWNDPEATAREFFAGFWKSGDLGLMDEEGFIKVLDRKKDMLNRGGFKIYSSEVEHVLMALPGILEAAIVGKPCPVLGERVHAFITVTDDAPDTATITAYCKANLSDYKVPESWTVGRDPLPRNPNGKLLKREMRDELLKSLAA